MSQYFIYPNDDGSLSNGHIIIENPLQDAYESAALSVPTGKPFLIIDSSFLPNVSTMTCDYAALYDAQTSDFSTPHGIGISSDIIYQMLDDRLALQSVNNLISSTEDGDLLASLQVQQNSLTNDYNTKYAAYISAAKININISVSPLNIDMGKARIIKQNQLRRDREPLFIPLDIAFARAQETQADASAIIASKQKLRAAPEHPSIAAAQSLEDLSKIDINYVINN